MSAAGRIPRLRLFLVAVGTFVWVPYLVLKYGMGREVSALPVLAIHVPCMVGALGLRLFGWSLEKRKGGG